MCSCRVTRSASHDAAASAARAAPESDRGERRLRVPVDRVEHAGGAVALDQRGGALGADVLDPAQVGDQRLGVGRRQRPRLGDLDLQPVAAVVDPGPDDVRALALLEVDQRADEHDRLAVGAAASTTAQPARSLA